MNRTRVVVSSCGTSVLTNQTENELRNLINKVANHKELELSGETKQRLEKHIQQRKTLVEKTKTPDEIKKLSAELNGIVTYYGNQLASKVNQPDQHFLIVSDTYLGKSAGNIIRSWLELHNFNVQMLELSGLVTNDRDSFRVAMSDLIRRCQETLVGYRESDYHVAFNLTGGFKSVQGFLQTIGMFYADESFYIFETGTLLTIPKLPIALDASEIIDQHLDVLRQLGAGLELPVEDVSGIPETLLLEVNGKVLLSEWGELIWQQSKTSHYSQRLLKPFSDHLLYSDKFKKSVGKMNLQPDRLAVLNERLDQLNSVIQGKGANLKSLDLKKLKGNPRPPSTHECDVWSGDEYRLFGHYVNENQFQIDEIDRGLH